MATGEGIKFVLGEILLTYFDAAISIFSVAVKPNSSKMKEIINSYVNSLIEVWEKSFTSNRVLRLQGLVERPQKLVSLYYNKVHNLANRTSSKRESDTTRPKSIWSINKQWKEASIEFRSNSRKTLFPITSLFDIMKDEGAEKVPRRYFTVIKSMHVFVD